MVVKHMQYIYFDESKKRVCFGSEPVCIKNSITFEEADVKNNEKFKHIQEPDVNSLTNIMRSLKINYNQDYFIKGHLINANFGAENNYTNLFPITMKANSEHSSLIEDKVKKTLKDKGKTKPTFPLIYNVEITNTKLNTENIKSYIRCNLTDATGNKCGGISDKTIESAPEGKSIFSKLVDNSCLEQYYNKTIAKKQNEIEESKNVESPEASISTSTPGRGGKMKQVEQKKPTTPYDIPQKKNLSRDERRKVKNDKEKEEEFNKKKSEVDFYQSVYHSTITHRVDAIIHDCQQLASTPSLLQRVETGKIEELKKAFNSFLK